MLNFCRDDIVEGLIEGIESSNEDNKDYISINLVSSVNNIAGLTAIVYNNGNFTVKTKANDKSVIIITKVS